MGGGKEAERIWKGGEKMTEREGERMLREGKEGHSRGGIQALALEFPPTNKISKFWPLTVAP